MGDAQERFHDDTGIVPYLPRAGGRTARQPPPDARNAGWPLADMHSPFCYVCF
jgi:hypothetical protein